jgi:hypothetical protein
VLRRRHKDNVRCVYYDIETKLSRMAITLVHLRQQILLLGERRRLLHKREAVKLV